MDKMSSKLQIEDVSDSSTSTKKCIIVATSKRTMNIIHFVRAALIGYHPDPFPTIPLSFQVEYVWGFFMTVLATLNVLTKVCGDYRVSTPTSISGYSDDEIRDISMQVWLLMMEEQEIVQIICFDCLVEYARNPRDHHRGFTSHHDCEFVMPSLTPWRINAPYRSNDPNVKGIIDGLMLSLTSMLPPVKPPIITHKPNHRTALSAIQHTVILDDGSMLQMEIMQSAKHMFWLVFSRWVDGVDETLAMLRLDVNAEDDYPYDVSFDFFSHEMFTSYSFKNHGSTELRPIDDTNDKNCKMLLWIGRELCKGARFSCLPGPLFFGSAWNNQWISTMLYLHSFDGEQIMYIIGYVRDRPKTFGWFGDYRDVVATKQVADCVHVGMSNIIPMDYMTPIPVDKHPTEEIVPDSAKDRADKLAVYVNKYHTSALFRDIADKRANDLASYTRVAWMSAVARAIWIYHGR